MNKSGLHIVVTIAEHAWAGKINTCDHYNDDKVTKQFLDSSKNMIASMCLRSQRLIWRPGFRVVIDVRRGLWVTEFLSPKRQKNHISEPLGLELPGGLSYGMMGLTFGMIRGYANLKGDFGTVYQAWGVISLSGSRMSIILRENENLLEKVLVLVSFGNFDHNKALKPWFSGSYTTCSVDESVNYSQVVT